MSKFIVVEVEDSEVDCLAQDIRLMNGVVSVYTNVNTHMATEAETREANQELRAIAKRLAVIMQCNCDLDNWQPEASTGHSWVCNIHKRAMREWRPKIVAEYPLQLSHDQPPPSDVVTATGFEDDDIRSIGDQLAAMTPDEADELSKYLSDRHGVSWSRGR